MKPDEIIRNPSETLDMELKGWLRLGEKDVQAKVAKALIALRNQNGGNLIFGFDDKTCAPTDSDRPEDIQRVYHADRFQEILKDYALPPFSVSVNFGMREGIGHPIVTVPSGFTAPVITRREYVGVLKQHAVYVRSISSGMVSSAEPCSSADWEALMARCFDNREADIARFFQRHLTAIAQEVAKLPVGKSLTEELLELGAKHHDDRIEQLKLGKPPIVISETEGFIEVAVVVSGTLKKIPMDHFLNELFVRQPRMSGWPMWINPSGMSRSEQPFPRNEGWEALVSLYLEHHFVAPLVEFWRLDPAGKFYDRRNHQEDALAQSGAQPGAIIDWATTISRVTETLATARAFATALAATPSETTLSISFRWTGLRGRLLQSQAQPMVLFHRISRAEDPEVRSNIKMPLETQNSALPPYVEAVVRPLFSTFGASIGLPIIEELVRDTVSKRI